MGTHQFEPTPERRPEPRLPSGAAAGAGYGSAARLASAMGNQAFTRLIESRGLAGAPSLARAPEATGEPHEEEEGPEHQAVEGVMQVNDARERATEGYEAAEYDEENAHERAHEHHEPTRPEDRVPDEHELHEAEADTAGELELRKLDQDLQRTLENIGAGDAPETGGVPESGGAEPAVEIPGAFETVNSAILGPLTAGFGVFNIAQGLQRGGEKGAKQVIAGGSGVISGGAATLAIVSEQMAKAALPFAALPAAFSAGMELGDDGIAESPYDLVETASGVGQWANAKADAVLPGWLPGRDYLAGAAGLGGTYVGSVGMVIPAAYYGAKRNMKRLGAGLATLGEGIGDIATGFRGRAEEPGAATVDLPVTETPDAPDRAVAHDEAPRVDPWAVPAPPGAQRPRQGKQKVREMRMVRRQIGIWLAQLRALRRRGGPRRTS